jgi:hypothetical protein
MTMKSTKNTSEVVLEEPIMETETPQATPILQIAWTRVAHLDDMSKRRTKGYHGMRKWIAALGVLATLFAIITQTFFPNRETAGLLGWVVNFLLILTPALASLLAFIATKKYSNGDWLITRAGAEEIQKEIYFFRTILQKDSTRRAYLEKRLNDIQRQIYRGLNGEFSYEKYNGKIPPNYYPDDPNSDPGFGDLNGDEYFRFRLENQLGWHNKEINEYKVERERMTYLVAASGALGAILAALGGGFAIWVALTASITGALIGWQEIRNIDVIVRNYSKVVLELSMVYDHWLNLEQEERSNAEFYKMVRGCEEVLWAQNTEYIKSMQEALKDSDLDEEASLINRVIKESVDSAKRTKKAMADAMVDFTKETLQDTEEKVEETFKAALGSLAEEASSELVQKELEAMSKAATEMVQNVVAKASSLTSSLADIAKEFAHIDIGRDTTKEELNAILARYPKTNNIKG